MSETPIQKDGKCKPKRTAEYGEGSVYQRSDGRWVAQFGGRYKYAKTKEDAKRKLKEMRVSPEAIAKIDPISLTVKQYFAVWLTRCKKDTIKPASYDRLENTINHQITPYIGDKKFSKVTTDDCKKILDTLNDNGASHSVIKKTYDALKACFNYAVANGDILRSPMGILSPPSASNFENKDVRALTQDEENALLLELERNWVASGKPVYPYRDAFILALNTGLRQGELLALNWSDVVLEKNDPLIHVRKNVLYAKKRNKEGVSTGKTEQIEQKSPKSKASFREVPINKHALRALLRLRDRWEEINVNLGLKDDKRAPYVFVSENGLRASYSILNKQIKRASERCNLIGIGTHTLRHTFATRLFEKGADVKDVSVLLGHSSITVTYNTYIHVIKERKRDVVSLLE